MLSLFDKYFLSIKTSHRRQLDSLDGIRGIAVLWVLLGHMSNRELLPLIDMKRCAVYGVYLFFVLSGFLLALPFFLGDAARTLETWKKYFVRRVLRIYPAYLIVLLFYVILSKGLGFIPESSDVFLDAPSFFYHLALVDGKSVHWTIPIEMKFYMVLPVVITFTEVISSKLWGKAALISGFLAFFLFAQYFLSFAIDGLSILFYLPVFLLGFLTCAAYLMTEGAMSKRGKILCDAGGWLSFVLVIVTIPSVWQAFGFQEVDFKKIPILHGLIWACMLFCTLKGSGSLSRAFSLKWLRYLGIISFSIYLWHMPVIFFVKKTQLIKWGAFHQFGFVLIVTLILASLSYLWIEKPFLEGRLSRAIFEKLGLNLNIRMSTKGIPAGSSWQIERTVGKKGE